MEKPGRIDWRHYDYSQGPPRSSSNKRVNRVSSVKRLSNKHNTKIKKENPLSAISNSTISKQGNDPQSSENIRSKDIHYGYQDAGQPTRPQHTTPISKDFALHDSHKLSKFSRPIIPMVTKKLGVKKEIEPNLTEVIKDSKNVSQPRGRSRGPGLKKTLKIVPEKENSRLNTSSSYNYRNNAISRDAINTNSMPPDSQQFTPSPNDNQRDPWTYKSTMQSLGKSANSDLIDSPIGTKKVIPQKNTIYKNDEPYDVKISEISELVQNTTRRSNAPSRGPKGGGNKPFDEITHDVETTNEINIGLIHSKQKKLGVSSALVNSTKTKKRGESLPPRMEDSDSESGDGLRLPITPKYSENRKEIQRFKEVEEKLSSPNKYTSFSKDTSLIKTVMSIDSAEIDGTENVNGHRSHEAWAAAEKEWIRAEAAELKYHVSEEEESEEEESEDQRLSAGDDVCDPACDDDKSKIIHSNNGLVSAGYPIELPQQQLNNSKKKLKLRDQTITQSNTLKAEQFLDALHSTPPPPPPPRTVEQYHLPMNEITARQIHPNSDSELILKSHKKKGALDITNTSTKSKINRLVDGVLSDDDSLFLFNEYEMDATGNPIRHPHLKNKTASHRSRFQSEEDDTSIENSKNCRKGKNRAHTLQDRAKQAWSIRNKVAVEKINKPDVTKSNTVTFGVTENNEVHEYIPETESEPALLSGNDYDDDDTLTGRSVNSVYTKSDRSEARDVIKDFFLIGSGKGTNPGRRKLKYSNEIRRRKIKMKEEQSNNLLGMSTKTHYENETADSGVFEPGIIKSISHDSAFVASESLEETGKKKNCRNERTHRNDNSVQTNDEPGPLGQVWSIVSSAFGITESNVDENVKNEKAEGGFSSNQSEGSIENETINSEGSATDSPENKSFFTNTSETKYWMQNATSLLFQQENNKASTQKRTNEAESHTLDTKFESVADQEAALFNLALSAAKSKHKINALKYDELTNFEVFSETKFIEVIVSLPIGILFEENEICCWVTRVYDTRNATKSSRGGRKVKPGDQLAAINGKCTIYMTLSQICQMLADAPDPNDIELNFLRYTGSLEGKMTPDDMEQEGYEVIDPSITKTLLKKKDNLLQVTESLASRTCNNISEREKVRANLQTPGYNNISTSEITKSNASKKLEGSSQVKTDLITNRAIEGKIDEALGTNTSQEQKYKMKFKKIFTWKKKSRNVQ